MKKILKFINLKKVCSVIITLSLILSVSYQGIYATLINQEETNKFDKLFSKNNAISQQYGKITSINDIGSNITVINIQDLHCHYQTQKNINNIITELDKINSINTILVEGGYENLNIDWVSIKDNKFRTQVINKLLEDGTITGTEYYALINNKNNILKGLEDKQLHKENLSRLSYIISKKDLYSKIINKISQEIKILNNRYISKNNIEFSKLLNNYRNRKISSVDFYKNLFSYIEDINKNPLKYSNILPLKISNYPNISTYLNISLNTSNINEKILSKQFQDFIANLKNNIPYKYYQKLITDTNNFSNISVLSNFILNYAEVNNIDLKNKYDNLYKFLNNTNLSNNINPINLLKEEESLIAHIRMALSYDNTEYEVAYILDFLPYFTKYLNYSLTAYDWQYYKENYSTFEHLYSKYSVDNKLKTIEQDFNLINSYYDVNNDRNNIFLTKILNSIDNDDIKINISNTTRTSKDILQQSNKIIVVVAGGFHSEELNDFLISKNINSIIVTPTINTEITNAKFNYEQNVKNQDEILSQALALKLASSATDIEQQILLVKASLKSIGAQDIKFVESMLDNKIKITVLKDGKYNVIFENGKEVEIDINDKRDIVQQEQVSNILKDSVSVIIKILPNILPTDGLKSIFIPNTYSIIKNLSLQLFNLNIYFSDGTIFDIENSIYKGYALDGISPEIYSTFLPEVQEMLLEKEKSFVEKTYSYSIGPKKDQKYQAYMIFGDGFSENIAFDDYNVESGLIPNMDDTHEAEHYLGNFEKFVSNYIKLNNVKFSGNTKYLYINKVSNIPMLLSRIISNQNEDIKYRLYALMFYKMNNPMSRLSKKTTENLKQAYIDFINSDKIVVKNHFDLRAFNAGVCFILEDYYQSVMKQSSKNSSEINLSLAELYKQVSKSLLVNRNSEYVGQSNMMFVVDDQYVSPQVMAHEIGHNILYQLGFETTNPIALTIHELFADTTKRIFTDYTKKDFNLFDLNYARYIFNENIAYQEEHSFSSNFIRIYGSIFSSLNRRWYVLSDAIVDFINSLDSKGISQSDITRQLIANILETNGTQFSRKRYLNIQNNSKEIESKVEEIKEKIKDGTISYEQFIAVIKKGLGLDKDVNLFTQKTLISLQNVLSYRNAFKYEQIQEIIDNQYNIDYLIDFFLFSSPKKIKNIVRDLLSLSKDEAIPYSYDTPINILDVSDYVNQDIAATFDQIDSDKQTGYFNEITKEQLYKFISTLDKEDRYRAIRIILYIARNEDFFISAQGDFVEVEDITDIDLANFSRTTPANISALLQDFIEYEPELQNIFNLISNYFWEKQNQGTVVYEEIQSRILNDLPTKIAFVCSANFNRSAIAEILLKDKLIKQGKKNIEVVSGGMYFKDRGYIPGSHIDSYRIPELEKYNVDREIIDSFIAKQFDETQIDSDYIIVSSLKHKNDIIEKYQGKYPDIANRVFLFRELVSDISDSTTVLDLEDEATRQNVTVNLNNFFDKLLFLQTKPQKGNKIFEELKNRIQQDTQTQITFVCLANIHRSALQEVIFKSLLTKNKKKNIYVTSAGINFERMYFSKEQSLLEEYKEILFKDKDIDVKAITDFKSEQFRRKHCTSDYIIVADDFVKKEIIKNYPELKEKIVVFKDIIPDLSNPTSSIDLTPDRFNTKKLISLLTEFFGRLFENKEELYDMDIEEKNEYYKPNFGKLTTKMGKNFGVKFSKEMLEILSLKEGEPFYLTYLSNNKLLISRSGEQLERITNLLISKNGDKSYRTKLMIQRLVYPNTYEVSVKKGVVNANLLYRYKVERNPLTQEQMDNIEIVYDINELEEITENSLFDDSLQDTTDYDNYDDYAREEYKYKFFVPKISSRILLLIYRNLFESFIKLTSKIYSFFSKQDDSISYIDIVYNSENRKFLISIAENDNYNIRARLVAFMYLKKNNFKVDKTISDSLRDDFIYYMQTKKFKVKTSLDLRTLATGIFLTLDYLVIDDKAKKEIYEKISKSIIVRKGKRNTSANSNMYFVSTNPLTIAHEIGHNILSSYNFYSNNKEKMSIHELFANVTSNLFGSIVGIESPQTNSAIYGLFDSNMQYSSIFQEEHKMSRGFINLLNVITKHNIYWENMAETILNYVEDKKYISRDKNVKTKEQGVIFKEILVGYFNDLYENKYMPIDIKNMLSSFVSNNSAFSIVYDILNEIKDIDKKEYLSIINLLKKQLKRNNSYRYKYLKNKPLIYRLREKFKLPFTRYTDQAEIDDFIYSVIMSQPYNKDKILTVIKSKLSDKESFSKDEIAMLIVIDILLTFDLTAVTKEHIVNEFKKATINFPNKKTYSYSDYIRLFTKYKTLLSSDFKIKFLKKLGIKDFEKQQEIIVELEYPQIVLGMFFPKIRANFKKGHSSDIEEKLTSLEQSTDNKIKEIIGLSVTEINNLPFISRVWNIVKILTNSSIKIFNKTQHLILNNVHTSKNIVYQKYGNISIVQDNINIFISDDINNFDKNSLVNTGLKVNGQTIWQVKYSKELTFVANNVDFKEIAKAINNSKVLNKKILNKEKTNINSSIIIDENLDDIYIEDNIIHSNTTTNISSLLEISNTLGITFSQKTMISLVNISNENLYKALVNGSVRKVITEQQFEYLKQQFMQENKDIKNEFNNLRQKWIEIYIACENGQIEETYRTYGFSGQIIDNKIYDYFTQEQIEIEEISQSISAKEFEEKIIYSSKPILVDIKILQQIFNKTNNILDTYNTFDSLLGKIKIKFGFNNITEMDVKQFANNIKLSSLPSITQEQIDLMFSSDINSFIANLNIDNKNIVSVILNGTKMSNENKEIFLEIIKARMLVKYKLQENNVENINDKKLELLLSKLVVMQYFNKDNTSLLEEELKDLSTSNAIEKINKLYDKAIKEKDIVAINTIIETIIYMQDNKVNDFEDRQINTFNYKQMLAAA